MKCIFIFLLVPFAAMAQLPGREDDSLRKISDTMHFTAPFQFSSAGQGAVKGKKLLASCKAWLKSVKDSLPGIAIVTAASGSTIIASNVPATADISCTITISVKGKRYRCTLNNYIFHTTNGQQLPLKEASSGSTFGRTARIEKLIISRNHGSIFQSLQHYLAQSK